MRASIHLDGQSYNRDILQNFESVLRLYDYDCPSDRIAQAPASPRDSSKLLVYNRAAKTDAVTTFRRIVDHIPPGALVVFNRTKVIPARLAFRRSTGGMVHVLILRREHVCIHVWANRRLRMGEILVLSDDLRCTVEGQREREWILRPEFPMRMLDAVLQRHGSMPLPPYIKHTPLTPREQRRAYQAIFAKESGSIAAPTASLHFTQRVLASFKKKGIRTANLTLHVHLGTFAPLTPEQWADGTLHAEEYAIPAATVQAIDRARREGRPIIAVGTTVMRALESACDEHGRIVRPSGSTTIFIREGYVFRLVQGLVTNFHVPKSSLLMLVCAFAGRDAILRLYRSAIGKKFRLFSFGDAMLIL
jgi:S-adenosylmethionine:tRNA ribosyltransferase-isomerase